MEIVHLLTPGSSVISECHTGSTVCCGLVFLDMEISCLDKTSAKCNQVKEIALR